MPVAFTVRTTPHFERLVIKLSEHHHELGEMLEKAQHILQTDPYNRSRKHHILKLSGVSQGEGIYRFRVGRFRFRYDIYGDAVVLVACSLRREDTYA
jgi:mRNA-degrading endonuclease RelE of RelBE toxin-antitoxin system